MRTIGKYSIGIGDRFGHAGPAQLQALVEAGRHGVAVAPVWNKSNREHNLIGTEPADTRRAADAAVRALGWNEPYFVDADHVGLTTVDRFIAASDFFTFDVADFIGKRADDRAIRGFVDVCGRYAGRLAIDGIERPPRVNRADIEAIARKYLWAVQEAARVYRHVRDAKGEGNFVSEVSMDETAEPQTPMELFFILAAIAHEAIPVQTIAPKFTGRFNKGVDYVGNVETFEREFREDLLVIRHAVKEFGLPANLKLSVHSGSDKFSLYPPIRRVIGDLDAGLHLKTAGTTWLEELAGLAAAAGEGLAIAREVYAAAHARFDELTAPYATVVDIDRGRLPPPVIVNGWSGEEFAAALTHDPQCPAFNPHFRQMLHVSFKVAAEMGARYLNTLKVCEPVIAGKVRFNIFERHLKPLFV